MTSRSTSDSITGVGVRVSPYSEYTGTAEPRMPRVVRLDHVVLHVGAEPVLGAEEGGEPDLGRRRRDVDDVAALDVERGGVRDEADAAAPAPARRDARPAAPNRW